jgi:hypothetical protein
MKSVVRQVRFLVYPMEIVSASPFRLHRRIGPRPAFPGVDATVKAEGAAPFCRARAEVRRHYAHRYRRVLVSVERTILKGIWAKRFD